MGAGPSSQPSVCDFSEEQILKIDEEIKNISYSILELKKSTEYDSQYTTFVMQQSGIEAKGETTPPPPLVKKVILLDDLTRLLNKYKTILELIIKLCKKYKSVHVEERDVERDINEFISVNMIEVQTLFNTFNQDRIGIENSDDLKEPIGIITKINERFGEVIILKNEMKAILKQRKEAEQAQTEKMFSQKGGSSSSTSKKRKQMKMKMKMKSSNYRSKTRNSKKKYNRKSVKK
jgi:hypothetical protein